MIAVFVRPATPGRAKTRLAAALGERGAAELYRAFARDVIDQACGVPERSVELWVAGSTNDADLDFVPVSLPRVPQPETDLGTRMRTALEAGLARSGQAMVLGSDAPGLQHGD